MSSLEGQSLGRYHILEQLGEGGMATVYKGYDTRLESEVAIKVIRKDIFGTSVLERLLKRFEREAKALAHLTHTNIVKVMDYGEYQGSPYLVMPYLPGGTLKGRLGEPLGFREAARLLLPVARALAYAHERGLIHRDVKPSNILITEAGDPMLTDFGIAKILEAEGGTALTGTGVGIGTPEYMAPEQGMGGKIDARADVYALGVVFYEMVTGRKPFEADTPMAVMLKHITDPIKRPRQYAPDLPDAVEAVLIKALAKQPEDRYTDMNAFAAALEKLVAGTQDALADKAELSRISVAEPQKEPTEKPTPGADDAALIIERSRIEHPSDVVSEIPGDQRLRYPISAVPPDAQVTPPDEPRARFKDRMLDKLPDSSPDKPIKWPSLLLKGCLIALVPLVGVACCSFTVFDYVSPPGNLSPQASYFRSGLILFLIFIGYVTGALLFLRTTIKPAPALPYYRLLIAVLSALATWLGVFILSVASSMIFDPSRSYSQVFSFILCCLGPLVSLLVFVFAARPAILVLRDIRR